MAITTFINPITHNNIMVKSEKQRLHLARLNANQKGENNSSWKGGLSIHNGYRIIHKPKHRLAYKNGYVPEHRLIMEKHINRPLKKEEVIHHINGDRLDNRIENLIILTQGKHIKEHTKNYIKKMKSGEIEIIRDKKGRFERGGRS